MGYWLFNWLDEQHIQTKEDAKRVLSYPIVVDDLRQQVLIAARESIVPEPNDGVPILAGRGLDLSEARDCIGPSRFRCVTMSPRIASSCDATNREIIVSR